MTKHTAPACLADRVRSCVLGHSFVLRHPVFVIEKEPCSAWRKARRSTGKGTRDYLISTLAPAASSFFLISSASAFGTPVLTGGTTLVDKGFRFGKAQTGNDAADFLDDSDLLGTTVDENHVELGLFLDSRSSTSSSASDSHSSHRSSGAHAPLVFQGLHKFSDFQDGQSAEFIYDFANISHVILSVSPCSEATDDLRTKAFVPARNHWMLGCSGPAISRAI